MSDADSPWAHFSEDDRAKPLACCGHPLGKHGLILETVLQCPARPVTCPGLTHLRHRPSGLFWGFPGDSSDGWVDDPGRAFCYGPGDQVLVRSGVDYGLAAPAGVAADEIEFVPVPSRSTRP